MVFNMKARNRNDWDLSLLKLELMQLKRERDHLQVKRGERPLTRFEQERVDSIATEMVSIIRTVVSCSRQVAA